MDRVSQFNISIGSKGRPSVGLDIGSSAVRAVQLGGSAERPKILRFGQVGLEPGAVVEGEVRDEQAVATAVKKLWSECGFTTRRVVVNVSGQRVVVREAEVASMSASDFRSALTFEAQDLIPIPAGDSLMDFRILGEAPPSPEGRPRMRILLAAAHRESIDRVLGVVKLANLDVIGVDVAQSALLRRIEAKQTGKAFGLISVGADLTTVVVQAGKRGTFSRTLGLGTSKVTSGVGLRMGLEHPYAESAKRSAGSGHESSLRTAELVRTEAAPIVEQVRESLEYFVNRTALEELDVLLLTGGGSRTTGLPEMLHEVTGTPVETIDAFSDFDISELDPDIADAARSVALCAVGLASWAWEAPDHRLSLLPPEIVAARKRRQTAFVAAAGGAALLLGLGLSWYSKHGEVVSTQHRVAAVHAQDQALRGSSQAYSSVTSYFAAVNARQQALDAVGRGVDWPALIKQISAVMPASDTLSQLSLTASGPAVASGSPSTGSSSANAIPNIQITMTVKAAGGEQAVAGWLRAMAKVPSLSNVWVGSSTTSDGVTSFSCTATVTSHAPTVAHSWEQTK